jgi:carboxyl-terminal processing protease
VTTVIVVLSLGVAHASAAFAADLESQSKNEAITATPPRDLEEERELIRLFADTFEQIRSNYVDENITDRDLIEAAIRGMVTELDQYSNYIPPDRLDVFKRGVEREYGGIGIQVAMRDGKLKVISPIFGSPAYEAGLRAGDQLLEINGTSVDGLSIDDAVNLMKGRIGTEVAVKVLHPSDSSEETVMLKRAIVQLPTVLGYRRQADDRWDYFCDPQRKIGYIHLTAFSRGTAGRTADVIKRLQADGMQGLVLDLRFNPGGLLSEAIRVSDLFVRDGDIVSTEGRRTPRKTWRARARGTLIEEGFPVAVLVNRFSASASEIVAACLQDYDIAKVVGERTWGKGSVQNVIEMEGGRSALKLTTAGYQRPSGQNIHRSEGATDEDQWGVTPNDGYRLRFSPVEMAELDRHFRQQNILAADQPQDDLAESQYIDRQLAKAMEYVGEQLPQEEQPAEEEKKEPVGAGGR